MRKLKYFTIASFLRVVSWLSLSAAQRLGRLVGQVLWRLPTKTRQVTDINLAICLPELSASERTQLSKDSVKHTAMTALEIPLMWEWPVDRCLGLVRETVGLELVDDALASGKGLILLAPHLGNWELAGLYFSSRYKMAALYSPPNMAEFEEYMIKVRSRLGSEPVRGDRRGLLRMMTILKEGGIAGILPDQSPRGKTNAFAPFFGMEVKTMTLVAKLMQKTGANALITYTERLPKAQGFRIIIDKASNDLASLDPIVAATALNESVEALIRRAPEQYQWEYKRLRHRPAGEPNPYNPSKSQRE
ncbi:lipid A biosynthesis acyltransferase [Marinobacter psychrophilus]|jgi:KDO2-lipid IV(A) lauroyltransferase|uniref:Lipid A biosynthesis acyltransferase n=1 Tax=Marinobacter psychrophilus TaxID=330734 RepID=A0A0H4I1V4_9GAMM|nr:lysophospholipid acyltransferase family protein [Marinobacter psychrophilus]AKO51600.1 lipid A biosynthesis acyltransferase [Marinobacter psychrophilus]